MEKGLARKQIPVDIAEIGRAVHRERATCHGQSLFICRCEGNACPFRVRFQETAAASALAGQERAGQLIHIVSANEQRLVSGSAIDSGGKAFIIQERNTIFYMS